MRRNYFFIYNNFSKTVDSTISNSAASNVQNNINPPPQAHQSAAAIQNANDEQSYTPIKDNELSGLFKHKKTQPEMIQNHQTNSPFENAFGNSNKAKTADVQKQVKILQPIAAAPKVQTKETASQTPTAKLTQSEMLSKEPETEIPPASLKISVTRAETES